MVLILGIVLLNCSWYYIHLCMLVGKNLYIVLIRILSNIYLQGHLYLEMFICSLHACSCVAHKCFCGCSSRGLIRLRRRMLIYLLVSLHACHQEPSSTSSSWAAKTSSSKSYGVSHRVNMFISDAAIAQILLALRLPRMHLKENPTCFV